MSPLRLPALLLGISVLFMAISLVVSYALLPLNVASHFNAAGQPDAWTSRAAHVLVMALVGLGLPLLLLTVFWGVRYLPVAIVNLPHREYWLAPERRRQTSTTVLELGLWFVILQNLFFLMIHWLVVVANRQAQVQLSWGVWPVLAVYLLAVGGWLWLLWRRFRLPT